MEINSIKKFAVEVDYKLVPAICCWSDLLGVRSMASENNWSPSHEKCSQIIDRLITAQSLCMQSAIIDEQIFVFNDGFLRNLDLSKEPCGMSFFGKWLRSLICYHISINKTDISKGFAGARTIISGGERLLHNCNKVVDADLLFDKKKKRQKNILKKVIIENPLPLQMNTAFCKAYILDDGGSSQGLLGNELYIDQSAINLLLDYSRKLNNDKYIWEDKHSFILFAIPHNDNHSLFHLGFELGYPIKFNYKDVITNVYKVNSFILCDDDQKVNLDIPLNILTLTL